MPKNIAQLDLTRQLNFFRFLSTGDETLIIGFLARTCKTEKEVNELLNSSFGITVPVNAPNVTRSFIQQCLTAKEQIDGRTPMMFAVLRRDADLVRRLNDLRGEEDLAREEGKKDQGFTPYKVAKEPQATLLGMQDALNGVPSCTSTPDAQVFDYIANLFEGKYDRLAEIEGKGLSPVARANLAKAQKDAIQTKLAAAITEFQEMTPEKRDEQIKEHFQRLKDIESGKIKANDEGSQKKSKSSSSSSSEEEKGKPTPTPTSTPGFTLAFPDFRNNQDTPPPTARGDYRAFRDFCNAVNNGIEAERCLNVSLLNKLHPDMIKKALPYVYQGNSLLHYVMALSSHRPNLGAKQWFIDQYRQQHPALFLQKNAEGFLPLQIALRTEASENATHNFGYIRPFAESIIPAFARIESFRKQCQMYCEAPGAEPEDTRIAHSVFMDLVTWVAACKVQPGHTPDPSVNEKNPERRAALHKAWQDKADEFNAYEGLLKYATGMSDGLRIGVCLEPVEHSSPIHALFTKGQQYPVIKELFGSIIAEGRTIPSFLTPVQGKFPIHAVFARDLEAGIDNAKRFEDALCYTNLTAYESYKPHEHAPDINAKEEQKGYTALHMAALLGYPECVRKLMAMGADVAVKDKTGKTPVDLAQGGLIKPHHPDTPRAHYKQVVNILMGLEPIRLPKNAQRSYTRQVYQELEKLIGTQTIHERLAKDLTEIRENGSFVLATDENPESKPVECKLEELIGRGGDTLLHKALRINLKGLTAETRKQTAAKIRELITVFGTHCPELLTHANHEGMIPLQVALRHNPWAVQTFSKKTPNFLRQLQHQQAPNSVLLDMILCNALHASDAPIALKNLINYRNKPNFAPTAFALSVVLPSGNTAILRSALHEMVMHGRMEAIRAFANLKTETYPELYAKQLLALDMHGYTPVHHALAIPGDAENYIEEKSRESFKRITDALDALLEPLTPELRAQALSTPDAQGRTPLMLALATQDIQLFDRLRKGGANLGDAMKRSIGGFALPGNPYNKQHLIAVLAGIDDGIAGSLPSEIAKTIHAELSKAITESLEEKDFSGVLMQRVLEDYREVMKVLEGEYEIPDVMSFSTEEGVTTSLAQQLVTESRNIPARDVGQLFLNLAKLGLSSASPITKTQGEFTLGGYAKKMWGVRQDAVQQADRAYFDSLAQEDEIVGDITEREQQLQAHLRELLQNKKILAQHFLNARLSDKQRDTVLRLLAVREQIKQEHQQEGKKGHPELIKLRQEVLDLWQTLEPRQEDQKKPKEKQKPSGGGGWIASNRYTVANKVIHNFLGGLGLSADAIDQQFGVMHQKGTPAHAYYFMLSNIITNWVNSQHDSKKYNAEAYVQAATEALNTTQALKPDVSQGNEGRLLTFPTVAPGLRQGLEIIFKDKAQQHLEKEKPKKQAQPEEDKNIKKFLRIIPEKALKLKKQDIGTIVEPEEESKARAQFVTLIDRVKKAAQPLKFDFTALTKRDFGRMAKAIAGLTTTETRQVQETQGNGRRQKTVTVDKEHSVPLIKAVNSGEYSVLYRTLPTHDQITKIIQDTLAKQPAPAFKNAYDAFIKERSRYEKLAQQTRLEERYKDAWEVLRKSAVKQYNRLCSDGFFTKERAEEIRSILEGNNFLAAKPLVLDMLQARIFDAYDVLINQTHRLAKHYQANNPEKAKEFEKTPEAIMAYSHNFSKSHPRLLREISPVTLYKYCFIPGVSKEGGVQDADRNIKAWLGGVKKAWWPDVTLKRNFYLKPDGLNLTGANLNGMMLEGTSFKGTDLTNAQLVGARLKHAKLTNTTLTGANFEHAAMEGVLMSGVKGNAAKVGTEEKRHGHRKKVIRYAGGVKFNHAKMVGVSINDNSELAGAEFKQATLSNVHVNDSILTGADFYQAKDVMLEVTNSNLEHVNLGGVNTQKIACDEKTKKTMSDTTVSELGKERASTLKRRQSSRLANAPVVAPREQSPAVSEEENPQGEGPHAARLLQRSNSQELTAHVHGLK
jgi:uncharacterized protein YjbI with pentapeptide repeats/ankyrin repeat protein